MRSTLLLTCLGALAGCAVVESAGEVTFGSQSIERVSQEVLWPSADELSGLSAEDTADIDGFPTSLQDGTLAHLAGALGAGGECRKTIESEIQSDAVSSVEVSLAVCGDDDRCTDECGSGFRGMVLEVRVEMLLANEEQLADLKERLADVSPSAIVQVRLQFFELFMFQDGLDGEREDTTEKFDGFSLSIGDGVSDEVPLVQQRHLPLISEDTPQRFDIDGRSDFTKTFKRSIIAGQPISVTLTQRMRVPRPDLYQLRLRGAGTKIVMQPELVINVIDVAASSF